MEASIKQEDPFSVQVEFTEGCSMACDFCGIHGIREKPGKYNFMTPATAERIASEIERLGWNPRIEFAMHGEPTMNPRHAELVGIFRKHLPFHQLMLTANGSGLLKEGKVDALFEAGLDILALDDYHDGYVSRIPIPDKYPLIHYPADDRGNPHRRWPRSKFPFISVIADIGSTTTGVHGKLTNHTGCAFPRNDAQQGKRCAKPFREISIRWDGSVSICCEDWRGTYNTGNINALSLDDIWQGEAFTLARKHLYNGQRTFGPCQGCDNRSYRVGLLPDKLGKESLDPPTPEEHERAVAIGKAPALATIVLRPWEKQQELLV